MGTHHHYGSRRRRVMVASQAAPSSAPASASGSLAVGDVVASGSASAATPATGGIAIGGVVAAGSTRVVAPASGGVALGDAVVSGSGVGVVSASGALASASIVASGSSAAVTPAAGSLAVGDASFAGSAAVKASATGGIAAGDVVILGASTSTVFAMGGVVLDDVAATGFDHAPNVALHRTVAPPLAMRTQTGDRRRRVIVSSSNTPSATPAAHGLALTRVVVARRFPAPASPPATRVIATRTRVVLGGDPPPHSGGGGSPKPLQSSWVVGAIVASSPKPRARPIVARTRYVQPPRDGLPNQVVVAPGRIPARPRPAIVVRPPYKWGVNHGKPPKPPVVAGRPTRRPVPASIAWSSPPTSGLGFPPIVDPVVVRRPDRLRVRGSLTVFGLVDAGERLRPSVTVVARPVPRRSPPPSISTSTGDAFAVRPTRPPRPIMIPALKAAKPRGLLTVFMPADAFEMPPPSAIRAVVVPAAPRITDRRRPPLVVAARSGENPRALPAFDPVVVARPVAAQASPWFYISNVHLFAPPPPPRHEPLPRVGVVAVPRRRSPLEWPRPVVTTSILQPDSARADKPWDLIAACIARLRRDARIVAEFGDAGGAANPRKFVSDVATPDTAPPYVVFDEPMEVEDYETLDDSHRYSSLVRGSFNASIFDAGKLSARRRADMVAASLQDAPLVFVDGLLIYLRRSERRFPTVTVPGVGSDAASYKRTVEFVYMIERFFS